MGKMTIKQLREAKGNRQISVVNVQDVNFAAACANAGVDNIALVGYNQ
jgi:glutamate synthase domain-containing protein 2